MPVGPVEQLLQHEIDAHHLPASIASLAVDPRNRDSELAAGVLDTLEQAWEALIAFAKTQPVDGGNAFWHARLAGYAQVVGALTGVGLAEVVAEAQGLTRKAARTFDSSQPPASLAGSSGEA